MTDEARPVFRMTRRFEASPERLFRALTDPAMAARWLFTSPESEQNSTELDVRVGGAWTITDRREGVDYTALGEYLEIDPPRRLVFTFGMPQFSPEFDRVVVEITPDGTGSQLTLVQELLPPEYHEPIAEGWGKMFDVLGQVLADGESTNAS